VLNSKYSAKSLQAITNEYLHTFREAMFFFQERWRFFTLAFVAQ